MLFQTERLMVRPLTEDDVEAMCAVYGDADTMRWVDDGRPLDRAGCLKWIEVTRDNYATRGYGMAALVLRETGDVVGFCGLVHPGGQEQVEIKYALLRSHWGRGLASESVVAMLAYGVRMFDMKQICATVAPDNVASHRVLLKCGMQHAAPHTDDAFTELFVWRPETMEQTG